MKIQKLSLIIICALVITFSVSAQSIKLKEGNLNFLKGEKLLNIEYVYDGMRVGRYANEVDYINRDYALEIN